MKLGQGNIFTPVCDSVNRGVYLVWSQGGVPGLVPGGCTWSGHRGGVPGLVLGGVPDRHTPQTRCTPWDQVHPLDQVHPPGPGTLPLGPGTPPLDQVHPPGPDTPPEPGTPPEYGQRAAGTHPTGMHSCLIFKSHLTKCFLFCKLSVL